MAFAITDLPDLLKDVPAGAWVAISEQQNKVVAYGVDALAVFQEAQEKGEAQPFITRVPEQSTLMFF